ncbi:MAG: hypothetical protein H7Z43_03320 [Clostridia bacterium]|nr:hypothetical protein [Deltaproteobacteria bacterium]
MSFDPKIPKVGGTAVTQPSQVGADTAEASAVQRAKLAMPDLDAARIAVQQPSQAVVPPGRGAKPMSGLETRFAELERQLGKRTSNRAKDIQSAIALVGSSAARRSRGARKLSGDLCSMMDDDAFADATRLALSLEDALQSGDAGSLLDGLAEASELEASVTGRARGLVYAQASHALTYIAQHDPRALEALTAAADDDVGESSADAEASHAKPVDANAVFERAFALAEDAIAAAPELAEGYAALAMLVMLHGDPQALRDAERLTIAGFKFESDHDGCTVALATIRLAQGEYAKALDLTNELTSRGYARATAVLLEARAQRGLGDLNEAREAIARGLKISPDFIALHLEACVIARQRKDSGLHDTHWARLVELLGSKDDAEAAVTFAFG